MENDDLNKKYGIHFWAATAYKSRSKTFDIIFFLPSLGGGRGTCSSTDNRVKNTWDQRAIAP